MDLTIKQKLNIAENAIKENKIENGNIYELGKEIIQEENNKEIIHSFLDLAHLSNTSTYISKIQKTDEWLSLLIELIKKSNFHTGFMLRQRCVRYEKKIAFNIIEKSKIKTITYSSLWLKIIEVTRSLSIFEKEDEKLVIGLLTNNNLNGVLIDLACLSFGYRIIPIPLNATTEHISYILAHSEITHLFVGGKSGNKHWNKIKQFHSLKTISLDHNNQSDFIGWEKFLEMGDATENFNIEARMSSIDIINTQSIMYTSGTTDNPKGITFNQLNLISKRFARALAIPNIGSEDTFLCYLPLFHTFGRYFELMGSIFWGATYSFAESPAFNSLLNDFQIIKPTIFISIPKRWVQLYELLENQIDIDSDKTFKIKNKLNEITGGHLAWGLSAAGYLDPDIFTFFQDHGIKVLSGYGMTEATGGITMTPIDDYKRESVGKALPGIELKLAEDGELCIRGPYVTNGYFKEDDSKEFTEEWFHTKDVFMEKEKHYFFLDRKKDIYKNSRGQTIAPQKIENLFQDFESIKTVFLVGDRKEYNTVLIYPNHPAFINSKHELNQETINEIRETYSSMILSVNSFLSPYERIVNYAIIKRDFSEEKGELTPKKTFVRKTILKNFKDIIEPLYEKNHLSVYNKGKEIKIPNWIIREIGTLNSNVFWDGNHLSISDSSKSVILSWNDSKIIIGDYIYTIETDILDLDSFIQSPNLWLGNFSLTDFTGPTIFRIKEPKTIKQIKLTKINESINSHNEKEEYQTDNALYKLHNATRSYLKENFSSIDEIQYVVDKELGNWSTVIIDTFVMLSQHSTPLIRIKLLEAISPLIKGDLFVGTLREIFVTHINSEITDEFTFSIERTNDDHFNSLINYLQKSKIDISETEKNENEFIKILLLLIAEFGIIHPTRFVWARSEIVSWQLKNAPKPIFSTAQKAYYLLVKGFRSWLGHSPDIAVDYETGEEYNWKDVLTFDDNIRQKHRKRLLKSISETSLIKESIFLFSKNHLIDLNDIPKKGIWVTHLGTRNNKVVFRLLVATRNFGSYNLVINLNEGLDRDFIDDETIWLIKMGRGLKDDSLVENFGGYWPEHDLFTEEYIQGETLDKYLDRNKIEINKKVKVDRWQMRWLHFIWSGIQAYQEFWNRSNLRLTINPPTTENLIIPHHDYKTGTRLISISRRRPIKSLSEHFLSLYTNYIIKTERKYIGLSHMSDWEVIFTATIQALKVRQGMKILDELKLELKSNSVKRKCEATGLTKQRINQFLDDINRYGVLTKPVVFASLRFERWLELNPKATLEAKASILQELYNDYGLDKLLDEYPETRVRFFMMTSFKESGDDLFDEFKSIINDMRKKVVSPWNIQDRLSKIQSEINLSEEEKFFLAKMLFPHVNPAEYIELVTTTFGEEARLSLVSQTECKDGKLYRLRPPFMPKEIAKFHKLLKQSSLSVKFTSKHEFLLAFNNRNRLAGGLYWRVLEKTKIHLEWVAIRKKYRNINLSKRIMSDFFKRMQYAGINVITVGFYAQEFFSKHGFTIERQFGGMVKKL